MKNFILGIIVALVIDTYYFIDLLNKARNNCLLSYKYTSSSSSSSDNTPETHMEETEDKPKRTIIKPETNKEDNMTDKALTDYWCYVTSIMNRTTK